MNTLQKYEKYLYTILLIGIIIYFPILFNGFVWDDFAFIINNAQLHQLNVPALFGQSVFNSGLFYRPVPAVYFAIVYSLVGQHAFLYHFLQLGLHLIDTFLLFLLFCLFFSNCISFFLALIFLVHPINVESVAYIGSTTSELFFFFGITSFLLATKKQLNQNQLLLVFLLLLSSTLAKETGILFLPLILIYRYFYKLNKLKEFFFLGGLILIIYILFRVLVGGVFYSIDYGIPITTLSFFQRLINIPSIIIYYWNVFIFPLNLAVLQLWVVRTITLQNFIIPLFLSGLIFSALFSIVHFLYKTNNKSSQHIMIQIKKNHKKQEVIKDKRSQQFAFFLIWYLLGMIMIIQLIPLDMTVADRWFYFPIVGILGMIGVGLTALYPSITMHKKMYIWAAIILLSIFSVRTFIRNFDWKNNITLHAHDVIVEPDNAPLLNIYGQELFSLGETDEACGYIQKSVSLAPTASNLNELGDCYQIKQHYEDAITAYTNSLKLSKHESIHKISPLPIYLNFAQVLILDNRPSDAMNFIKNQALKEFPGNLDLLKLLSIAESKVNSNQTIFNLITPAPAVLQNK